MMGTILTPSMLAVGMSSSRHTHDTIGEDFLYIVECIREPSRISVRPQPTMLPSSVAEKVGLTVKTQAHATANVNPRDDLHISSFLCCGSCYSAAEERGTL